MKVLVKSICLFLAMFLVAPAIAGTVKEYSADLFVTTTEKKVPKEALFGKLYATEKKMRQDTFDEERKLIGFSIVRVDKNKIYSFQEENKTYVEFSFEGNEMPTPQQFANMLGGLADVKREKVGTETVNGYNAEKSKTTITTNIYGMKGSIVSYDWMAPEYNYPVRTMYEDKKKGDTIIDMRNIKAGKQPAELFEIPSGYTKDESMEELGKTMSSLGDAIKKAKQQEAENAPAAEPSAEKSSAAKDLGKAAGKEATDTTKEIGKEVKDAGKAAGKDTIKKGLMKSIGL
ncbi:MAG: DUF4412 domain-containing protein [Endomicrobia bacterium]|nr:DUF4412 domain-containing protein [Endomicrobiia bacterium]